MISLDVCLTREDASHVRAGELLMTEPAGRGEFASAYRYMPAYLDDPRAFPLDPRGLPLGTPTQEAQRLEPPLSVFRDALPDSWGRRVMIARYGLTGAAQLEPDLLRLIGARGLGALAFFESGTEPDFALDDAADTSEVAELVEAAHRFERGDPVDPDMARLLKAGSSAGGMRPKALFRDAHGEWIGKFRAIEDRDDVVGLEAASLELARGAGIRIPRTRLLRLSGGRKVLLVRRFDVTPEGGRRHVLSLSTLMQERRDLPVLNYEDVLAEIARFSTAPDEDLRAFYRHMVFNVALGNTDDHLKNWALITDSQGFRLAPAFDLIPDIGARHEHVLRFRNSNYPPDRSALISMAVQFNTLEPETIIDEVCEAVSGFAREAKDSEVPDGQIRRYEADIGRRLSKLSTPAVPS